MPGTTELTFKEDCGKYITTFTSSGPCVLQALRDCNKGLKIMAAVSEMPPVVIYERGQHYSASADNMIVYIDVPEGIEVSITSDSPVSRAVLYNEKS